MKILHTSDWHLGHSLYGHDRTEEQDSMLRQIIDLAEQESPDLFLLCGDIFHTATPSAFVQQSFANAVMELRRVCPEMAIVAIAGNHDSGTRHEIFRSPWEAMNVYAIGNVDKENPEYNIVKLSDKCFVLAIPYIHERYMPADWIARAMETIEAQNETHLPVIIAAHTTILGCDYSGHEQSTERTVGGIDSLDIAAFGAGYDYLALGHIHKRQSLSGRVHYSGTPLAVSFDERYEHSVTMVDIGEHGALPLLRHVAISNPKPLVTLPTTGFASWNEAKDCLENFPCDISAYIRLNVLVDNYLPVNANFEALDIASKKMCTFCQINARRKEVERDIGKVMTIAEFQQETPQTLLKRYMQEKGITYDDETEGMMKEVISLLNEDKHNQ